MKWNGHRLPLEEVVQRLLNALKGLLRFLRQGPFGSQPVSYDEHTWRTTE